MLQSNIPTDKRRPGTFVTFDDVSGARGLTPSPRSVCCVGMKHSSGTWTLLTPVQVYNEAEADAGAGRGSELALMLRSALKTFRKQGSAAALWAVPITEPSGTAATRTFTVAGTATGAGDALVLISGRLVRVPIKVGDSSATVAAALKAATDIMVAQGVLPGLGSIVGSVVTFTYRHLGINGADIKASTVSSVPGITITTATGVTGSGVADIQPALDVLGSRDYLAVAIANHAAADLTDLGEHADLMWAASRKRFRHMFVGETGTLGTATTLAAAQNRKEIVLVSFEGGLGLPGEYAAAVAAMTQTHERPSHNWNATELDVPGTTDALNYEDAEVETALAGGVTPLTMSDTGKVRVERLVTTKATQAGAAFEPLRDFAASASAAYYARQVDQQCAIAMQGQNLDAELLRELHGIAYDVLKRGEELGDLHHVDDHADELKVEAHADIPTRAVIEIPVSVVPIANQVDATVRFFSEAA